MFTSAFRMLQFCLVLLEDYIKPKSHCRDFTCFSQHSTSYHIRTLRLTLLTFTGVISPKSWKMLAFRPMSHGILILVCVLSFCSLALTVALPLSNQNAEQNLKARQGGLAIASGKSELLRFSCS